MIYFQITEDFEEVPVQSRGFGILDVGFRSKVHILKNIIVSTQRGVFSYYGYRESVPKHITIKTQANVFTFFFLCVVIIQRKGMHTM